MAKIIRAAAFFFWLIATGFLAVLAYTVIQTESDPQALRGWLILCFFTFLAATILAYNSIFGRRAGFPDKTEE